MSRIQVSFEKVVLVKEKVGRYELPKRIGCPEDVYRAITVITSVEEEAQEVFGILKRKRGDVNVHTP